MMSSKQQTVLVVGATGYLGGHLVKAFHAAGYIVHALARSPEKLSQLAPYIDRVHQGEATKPESLNGICSEVDIVISALGITRQRDGLSYMDVDYQANRNILDEAIRAGVERFAYVHVLNAEQMLHIAMAAAKSKFANELDVASINSTIICPSGFYSDLAEILKMAQKGKVYLFGNGEARISPIDGADLAKLCVASVQNGETWVKAGGPQSLSQNEIATLAFETFGTPPRISHIPLWLARFLVGSAKIIGFGSSVGALDFFLATSLLDMTAPPHGEITLAQDYAKGALQLSRVDRVSAAQASEIPAQEEAVR